MTDTTTTTIIIIIIRIFIAPSVPACSWCFTTETENFVDKSITLIIKRKSIKVQVKNLYLKIKIKNKSKKLKN